MKAQLINEKAEKEKAIELPKNFSISSIRKDIVQKVFEAQKRWQTHGTKIGAGANYSASGIIRRKRHAWKSGYGRGMSRVPRKTMARSGSSFTWVGATVASTVGGREAHPPKVEENQFRKINKKELLIAINSCLSASANKRIIEENYNIKLDTLPIVFSSNVLKLKTKEFFNIMRKIIGEKFDNLLQNRKIRSGKGKMRGRKYRKSAGILFVISSNEEFKIKGLEIKKVEGLKIDDLSLNGKPGRFILFSENAIKEIGERWKKK
ncbi:MAG: 50S ribosomal protein L4 [Candidatus Pacearchaeota archaeon]